MPIDRARARELIRQCCTGVNPARGEMDAPLVYSGGTTNAELPPGIYTLAADGYYDYTPFPKKESTGVDG